MIKILIVFCSMMSTAFAQNFQLESKVMTPYQISKLIGPAPKAGSAEEILDFKTILYYQQFRTAKDCEQANLDERTSLAAMFGGPNGVLNNDEVRRLSGFLLKAYASSGVNAYIAKSTFRRPRPYVKSSLVKPCIPLEDSYAYPSGHSMVVRLYAQILAKVFPERAELLLKRASQYSLSRVIGGVHHPSDVRAAFVLADYMAKEMIENENFVKVLDTL